MSTLLRYGSAIVPAVCFGLFFAGTKAAAEDGWKLPLWRPFASKPDAPSMNVTRRSTSAPFHSTGSTQSSTTSKLWSGMASGTKRAWNTTVDVVTLKPIRRSFSKPAPSGPQLGFKPDPRKKKQESQGVLGSLFAPKKPREPSTVDEFFSQERP